MSNEELLDVESENKKLEHKFIFTKNEAKLTGIFAWLFYANLLLWSIVGLMQIVADVKTFI